MDHPKPSKTIQNHWGTLHGYETPSEVADLRRELPWPSEMATVRMEGRQISEAEGGGEALGGAGKNHGLRKEKW